ncbi:MAG TPA: alpha/beta fold hydrolase [Candidatus Krumholzibacteria bacterium]|nr:alpha/beta fold hydrolase [Candidatus Krumholzibacteria bacterium]HPD73123.1 alpha/beta fold hydrolase [Candidatus Krumholzibacteria bacterium]HRY41923.1 alpha/beta fold hydrolase [Candidatus Krumholzibacteria bacterium]
MSRSSATNRRSARDGYFETVGTQIYWREVGAGAPLIALHGGPDFNHNYFLPELDTLGSACRLIYYDQRGRGKSSGSVVPHDVSLDSELRDLDALRVFLEAEEPVLLGHSFGALLAMEYAARYTSHVSRLILMNPAPGSYADRLRFIEHRRVHESDNLARMEEIAGTRKYAMGDIATEAEYYRLHFGSALMDTRNVQDVVARLRVHFTPAEIVKARAIEERLYSQTWCRPNYDVIVRLGHHAPATLVIHGADDFIPLECSANIARGIARARLEVIDDCGHFAYLERPRECAELIRGFIASI